ncbi:MAG: ATP-binding protein [Clostridia bacterium]|nr:ATP-binding protein [Clostridia bacterium]
MFNIDEQDNLNILPSYIENIDFKYIKVDNKYISSLIIKEYPKKSFFLDLIETIPKNFSYDISMFLQKQDIMKFLKELTYYISSSSAEINTISKNQVDIDILNKSKDDAKNLRREIQINNEEIYNLSFIITFYSIDKSELLQILKSFQTKLFSKQIVSIISNFRHLDAYLLNLPLNDNKNRILKTNYRSMTTSCVTNFFPFYTKNVFDENGIIFGMTKNDNKLFNIDIFSNKYFNSNMCIFGSSGSGKSFFTKLMIFKEYMNSKVQYIFDPEGEYNHFIKMINGEVFSLSENTYINIMQIFDLDINRFGSNVVKQKINEVLEILKKIINIESDEDISYLHSAIINAYKSKNITFDIRSLYKISDKNSIYIDKVIKDTNDFPILTDILNYEMPEELTIKLRQVFTTKLKCFSTYTNVDIHNKLILFDTRNINNLVIKFILEKMASYLKNHSNKNKTIIYIDEVWRYVNNTSDENISSVIFMLFKTIRKNNAGIVTITQDITDFFAFENGNYGKSILNNCCFKMFFKVDYLGSEILKKLGVINSVEINELMKLDKGEAVISFKNNITTLNIKASEYERNLIEGDSY